MNNIFDTPKITPDKNSHSHNKQIIENALFSPFPESNHNFLTTFTAFTTFTPLHKHPEYLLSPSPVKKDLFTQLLGTETRQYSPTRSNRSLEEESLSFSEISEEESDSLECIEEQKLESSENGHDSDENEARKRKRKSTAQIKMLKQELDGEVNWSKEKIGRMADITGLSQSQVYKWFWDQKKKNNKDRDGGLRNVDRRKLIHKNLNYRHGASYKIQKEAIERNWNTKVKVTSLIYEDDAKTDKKVSKRLIFQ